MKALQGYFVVAWIVLAYVSTHAIASQGLDGGNVFITDFAHPWRAQFNTDFTLWAVPTAVWVFWRHASWLLGLLCAVATLALGGMFLMPYLLVASIRAHGDARRLLLGAHWPATSAELAATRS
jgi:hypothetical protein